MSNNLIIANLLYGNVFQKRNKIEAIISKVWWL